MNKQKLEILRKAFAPKPIRLGQPPWSEEELTHAYFRNPTETTRKVDSRPGAKFANAINALELSLALFKDSLEALFASIETFRQESLKPNFDWRVSLPEQERIQLAVRRNLFSSTAAALALV